MLHLDQPKSAANSQEWMLRPNPIPGVPRGLEYLTQINQLVIEQKVDLLEAFTGWEESNRYVIRNSVGQQIYYAFEQSDTCQRQCCLNDRGFVITIVDNFNQPVLRISREFKCCAGCCWCAGCCIKSCAFEVKVETADGQFIGLVRQLGSFWKARYEICDSKGSPILLLVGPCCICHGACCTCDNDFILKTLDENTVVGKITRKYSGFVKELFTYADNFSINCK